jgi:hypothetical protein
MVIQRRFVVRNACDVEQESGGGQGETRGKEDDDKVGVCEKIRRIRYG